ncbi:MAG: bifunctional folylpolyglutamate synthase/dihydrofolate synthase, partial [Nitriliruptorales bacterium]|nr:bifunctional folylpolyglutamate synthase/dihydrofolate synthase [Nitriliruptorales bacterium]
MTDFDEAVAAILDRGPGRMIPDLDRIRALADLMGDPQRTYPSIHVTGTNGKGSTVRMITALLGSAGIAVGTYTSPHLQSIRERLSIAGRPITEYEFAQVYDDLAALAVMVDEGVEHPEDHVTFFEFLTAMAYWWFADRAVDVGVFEVGMGGRWDAT